MSLPQRKKSAEEIAKLRESLGIVAPPPIVEGELPVEKDSPEEEKLPMEEVPPAEDELPAEKELPADKSLPILGAESEAESSSGIAEPVSAISEPIPEAVPVEEIPAASPLVPLPVSETHDSKVVRSLKRSERIPVLPVEESGPPPASDHSAESRLPMPANSPLPAPPGSKIVRSLRKSEQGPLPPAHEPRPDSKLPIHRHSDDELNRIRRQEVIAQTAAPAHPLTLTAHLVIVIPGYLAALAGGACFYFYDVEKHLMSVTAGCVVVALAIAAFIFFKKPLSRHHAAFIAVLSLLVIVFGALHYFPTLQHGT